MMRPPPRSTRVRSSAASDVYKRQLIQPAAAQVPGHLVRAAWTAEALPPALLEEGPPASVLRRIHLHELHQRLRMTHAHDRSSLETDYTREDREPTGRKGMVSLIRYACKINHQDAFLLQYASQ